MALATILTAACVGEARIAMPSDLALSSERIELTGMGGWSSGRFRLGDSEGRFSRLAFQEVEANAPVVWNAGGGDFEVDGPEVGRLAARCAFEQAEMESGIVTVTTQPFAYRCAFRRDGRPIEAGLVLEAVPRSPGRAFSGITRAGEIHIDGTVVTIRAIHDFEGGRVPTGTPLGYLFEADGRAIGAVDLNGGDKTIFAPRTGPERQAVLAASLALSVLWDPGE